MINRLNVIAQAANKIKVEKQSKQLKFAGIARQAVSISDKEYTSKKEVDNRTELVF